MVGRQASKQVYKVTISRAEKSVEPFKEIIAIKWVALVSYSMLHDEQTKGVVSPKYSWEPKAKRHNIHMLDIVVTATFAVSQKEQESEQSKGFR
jgi:hypothetical protein